MPDSLNSSLEISSPNSQQLNYSDEEGDDYRGHSSASQEEAAAQTINAMAEEIQALEKLLEESAQVIGQLREKVQHFMSGYWLPTHLIRLSAVCPTPTTQYNDQKADNKHIQKRLEELETDNESYQTTNEKLEIKAANLENDLALLQRELNLENTVNAVLSDETQLEELNSLVAANRDLFHNEDNGFFEEYNSYMEKYVNPDGKQSCDVYEEIIANLKYVYSMNYSFLPSYHI